MESCICGNHIYQLVWLTLANQRCQGSKNFKSEIEVYRDAKSCFICFIQDPLIISGGPCKVGLACMQPTSTKINTTCSIIKHAIKL